MDPPDFPFTQRRKQINLDLCLTTARIRDRHDMPVSQKFVMTGYLRHGEGDRASLRADVAQVLDKSPVIKRVTVRNLLVIGRKDLCRIDIAVE